MDTRSDALAPEHAYVLLKEDIITHRLKPGDRLRTVDIAQSMGMSRTPIREALGRLAQEGLVRRDKGWGYIVNTMSIRDILNLFNVREVLEVEAALEAIPYLNAEALQALSDINKQAEKSYRDNQYDAFLSKNRMFYIALASMTHNQLLQQMLGMIHDRVRWVGFLIVGLRRERANQLLLANRLVMKALVVKDAMLIETAVRSHIKQGREHVLSLLPDLDVTTLHS